MLPDLRTWPLRLGASPGDTVQLMADLTRLSLRFRRENATFSPDLLLDAFASAVGPNGSVLVPTYTFDLEDGDVFDVRSTRSISGILANAALASARFHRTPHPLHSFAVAGAATEDLVTNAEQGSFGPASPFGYLHRHKGRLIALDLRLDDALTYVHYVEECVEVSYRKHREARFQYTDKDGKRSGRRWSIYAKRPGHHMRFTALSGLLAEGGALVEHTLDGVKVLVVDLEKAHAIIEQDIRTNDARSIHQFRWKWWVRDMLKALLRTFGIRPGQARTIHAADPR
ncbi:MAG: AAC(3) family N-acetyltransferase [Flavobacteriales bacterium]|nr:AAC(3) family N-acetyltransferase [Flavobacteriales bacterium]MBK9286406.1 AAC(3) family N-acetyltransferase [Flavobacteriales bacterium]MBL0034777.1 AAC(3) family N-acetyltransferase [Flavobacteriales bacterium]